MMHISSNIRYHRQRLKLTQKELAIKLNKKESTIRMWELGKNEPSLNSTVLMADIFKITLDELVEYKGYCTMKKNIGFLIKEIRNTKKITQQKLADKAGVSRSYLNDVENNRYKPSIEFLQSLSTALSNGDKDEYYTYLLKFMDALGYIEYNYIEKLIIEKHIK